MKNNLTDCEGMGKSWLNYFGCELEGDVTVDELFVSIVKRSHAVTENLKFS